MLITLGMLTTLFKGAFLIGVIGIVVLTLLSLIGDAELRFVAYSFFGGAEGFLLVALGG
jgi:hypothetical protein